MAAPIHIKGTGTETAEVHDNGLMVSQLQYPPLNVPNNIRTFANFATINNDGVSFDLTVAGSVANPVEAFVQADGIGDLYLTTMSILLGGQGTLKLGEFCDIAPLPIGLQGFYTVGAEEALVSTSARTNFDLIRLAGLTPGFASQITGSSNTPFLIKDIDLAGNSAYNAVYDFSSTISPGGVRLMKGSRDRFGIRIFDDLSAAGILNVILTGYYRI